jgi:hypothetical protein
MSARAAGAIMIPARIRKMSKRRQKRALVRLVTRNLRMALARIPPLHNIAAQRDSLIQSLRESGIYVAVEPGPEPHLIVATALVPVEHIEFIEFKAVIDKQEGK